MEARVKRANENAERIIVITLVIHFPCKASLHEVLNGIFKIISPHKL